MHRKESRASLREQRAPDIVEESQPGGDNLHEEGSSLQEPAPCDGSWSHNQAALTGQPYVVWHASQHGPRLDRPALQPYA